MFNYPRESVFNPLNNSFSSTFNPNIDKILNNYFHECISYIFLNYEDIKNVDKALENTWYKEDVIIDFLLDSNQDIKRINSVNVKGKVLSEINDIKDVLKEYELLEESKTLSSTTEQLLKNKYNICFPSKLNYFNISEDISKKFIERVEQIRTNHSMDDEESIVQQILAEYLNTENARIIKNNLAYLQKIDVLERISTFMLKKEDGIYDLDNGSGIRYEKQGNNITCYDYNNDCAFEISSKEDKEVYKIYNEGLDTLSEEIEIKNNKGKKEYKANFYDRKGNFLGTEDINQLILYKSNCKQLCDFLNINEEEYNEFIINEQIKVSNLKESVYSNFVL